MNHPLRGNVFENMVIQEIFKLRLNKGEKSALYFYRDSNQLEVDLIFQQGLELIAVEVKSSKTFNKNFLKGLTKFTQLANDKQVVSYVVYGGDYQQEIKKCQVLNYKNLAKIVI